MTTYNFETLATLLVLIGAINWGIVAYKPSSDLVKLVKNEQAEMYIKYIIGACGAYLLFRLVSKMQK
jgi:uncharacterized membrane protein YuzA (DUF378 family)